jgi:hypothetical protein
MEGVCSYSLRLHITIRLSMTCVYMHIKNQVPKNVKQIII